MDLHEHMLMLRDFGLVGWKQELVNFCFNDASFGREGFADESVIVSCIWLRSLVVLPDFVLLLLCTSMYFNAATFGAREKQQKKLQREEVLDGRLGKLVADISNLYILIG